MLLSDLLLQFLNNLKFHLFTICQIKKKAKLHYCTKIQCDMVGFHYTNLKFLRKLFVEQLSVI